MKTTDDSKTTPAKPRAVKRRSDPSLFANGDSGILLHFEDPAVLGFVRSAATAALQPSNHLELLLTEQVVRNLWRTMRAGNLETAAIDVELSEHQESVENRWGKLDPESLYHLSTREPGTRAAIREYANVEGSAMRRFKEAANLIKSIKQS